jgi:hypothetical protein
MNFLPKIRKCPRCQTVKVLLINGITYENIFKSLTGWTLKKIFNCRKCKVKLGLFISDNIEKTEKLIWIDLLKCEESYYDHLSQLQIYKAKYNKQDMKYYETQKKINDIKNKIILDQINIAITLKVAGATPAETAVYNKRSFNWC